MQLEIWIDFLAEKELNCFYFDNVLNLTFNSFERFYSFLDHPLPITLDQDSVFLHRKEQQSLMRVLNKINRNITKLVAMIKKERVLVRNISPYASSALRDDAISFDVELWHLQPDALMQVLNAPWNSSALFKDRFNTIEDLGKEELLEAYHKIIKIADAIRPFSPTPAEIALYAFDVARNRKYIKSASSNNAVGRDLAKVLAREEIVCTGYANFFASICFFLGVSCDMQAWESKSQTSPGHASSLAYINDNKYDIHSIFSFDITTNCKKDDDDSFFDNCSHAFCPLQFDLLRKEQKYDLIMAGFYMNIKQKIERLKQFSGFSSTLDLITDAKISIIHLFNRIYQLIGKPCIGNDDISIEAFEQRLHDLASYSNAIPTDVFEKLIRNVRDMENAIDARIPNDSYHIDLLVASSSSKHCDSINRLFRALAE